jgi:uncharacterized protein YbaR (Trm112 family)
VKCLDCECIIDETGKEGDIIVCPDCGLEYELRDGILVQLVLDGEDFGE